MKMKCGINVRTSDEELDLIKKRMKLIGVTNMSAYIKKMAIDGYVVQVDLKDLKEILRLLRINSNNLNQYAKKANECGAIYYEDIKVLKTQQKEIWQEMRNLMDRLSKL